MANKRKRRILFLFIVPALVFYLVFWISPVLMSFFYGLTNWSGLGDYDFVGLDNFKFLIKFVYRKIEKGKADVTYKQIGAAIVFPIPIPFTIRYIGIIDICADTIIPAKKKI